MPKHFACEAKIHSCKSSNRKSSISFILFKKRKFKIFINMYHITISMYVMYIMYYVYYICMLYIMCLIFIMEVYNKRILYVLCKLNTTMKYSKKNNSNLYNSLLQKTSISISQCITILHYYLQIKNKKKHRKWRYRHSSYPLLSIRKIRQQTIMTRCNTLPKFNMRQIYWR